MLIWPFWVWIHFQKLHSTPLTHTIKTKEITLDFRKHRTYPCPLYIHGDCVERLHTFAHLGTVIPDNHSWSANTLAVIKKAQQHLHFLRVLRKSNICEKLLVTFYRSTIESILTYRITVWFSHCTEADRRRLQRVVETAQRIIGWPLSSLKDTYSSCWLSSAESITRDSTHPAHHLFDLLPSGRHYRSIKTRTNRLRNSFFPPAITAQNTNGHWQWQAPMQAHPCTRTHTHTHARAHTHITQGQCAVTVKVIVLYTKTLYIIIYLFF